jgi:hypothetical protein
VPLSVRECGDEDEFDSAVHGDGGQDTRLPVAKTIMSLKVAVGHLARWDWENAHAIVQDDESALECWAHGIVHLLEGDMDNAAYWYRRAGRPFRRRSM